MSQEDIKRLLNKLKEEIKSLDVNSVMYREIISLISDIENQLLLQKDKQEETSLINNIRDCIGEFEVEHPRITNVLNDLIIKLISIGV
jgi:hypothetical protein